MAKNCQHPRALDLPLRVEPSTTERPDLTLKLHSQRVGNEKTLSALGWALLLRRVKKEAVLEPL